MSKESRLAAKKRSKQAKRKRIITKLIKVLLVLALIACIGLITRAVIINRLGKNAKVDSYLKDDGTIKSMHAATFYVNPCDYKNLTVERTDLLPTGDKVDSSVQNVLKGYTETVTEAGTALTSTSAVTLSYTVTVDGAVLDSYTKESSKYTLGTETYGTEFDNKIAALKVGDSFAFDITFPAAEDGDTTDELAGKTATFEGTVEGVDVVPALTDDFVASNLSGYMEGSDYPLTADGLIDFCAYKLYRSNLESYVQDYITSNASPKKVLGFIEYYPFFYKWNQYYVIDKNYEYYVNYYNQMFGSNMYDSPAALLGLDSEKEYKKQLKEDAKNATFEALCYQAVYEEAGLSITDEDLAEIAEEQQTTVEDMIADYGKGYTYQLAIKDKVFHYVLDCVTENGDPNQMWVATPEDADESTTAE